jgi:hypothetical protein
MTRAVGLKPSSGRSLRASLSPARQIFGMASSKRRSGPSSHDAGKKSAGRRRSPRAMLCG